MGTISPFYDAKILWEWDDGYRLVEVRTHRDLKVLSKNGGGCAEQHAFLTEIADPQCEFIFVTIHDEQVGTILFCKRQDLRGKMHPQEDERKKWRVKHYGEGGMYSHIHSSFYDSFPDGVQDNLLDFEREIKTARTQFARLREQAVQIGPLRKGHPMKPELDKANKRITACMGAFEKERSRIRVCSGQQFLYRGTELFILQVSGRGTHYSGCNTRYTDKFVEFMTRESKKGVTVGTA